MMDLKEKSTNIVESYKFCSGRLFKINYIGEHFYAISIFHYLQRFIEELSITLTRVKYIDGRAKMAVIPKNC